MLADVDTLVKRVRKFRELGEPEVAWNDYIDTTLFLLAEAASVHQSRTTSTNMYASLAIPLTDLSA